MEKVLYVLTSPPGADVLDASARADLGAALRAAGAHHAAISVADAAVEPAAGLRMGFSGAPADAVVSVWVDSATDHLRADIDAAVVGTGCAFAAYLVAESVPLPAPPGAISPGATTDGFVQVAFIRRAVDLPEAEFLHRWLDRHTTVAIDLQDTFLYIQNVVVRRLTPEAPPLDAIVEEGFPAAAMTDPHAFFDTHGDADLLAQRQQAMFESVQGFIDLSTIDVLPTSRYVVVDGTPTISPRA